MDNDSKYSENDPERTLITLDQLSQTIEVMTSVVNRLRQHLSQQIVARQEIEQLEKANIQEKLSMQTPAKKREGFVVEVSKPETDTKDDKTFH